jgi:hypothetical protein
LAIVAWSGSTWYIHGLGEWREGGRKGNTSYDNPFAVYAAFMTARSGTLCTTGMGGVFEGKGICFDTLPCLTIGTGNRISTSDWEDIYELNRLSSAQKSEIDTFASKPCVPFPSDHFSFGVRVNPSVYTHELDEKVVMTMNLVLVVSETLFHYLG